MFICKYAMVDISQLLYQPKCVAGPSNTHIFRLSIFATAIHPPPTLRDSNGMCLTTFYHHHHI